MSASGNEGRITPRPPTPARSNGSSRLSDLKVIGIVLGIMGTLAMGIVGIGAWAQSLKPRAEAKQDHTVLHDRVTRVTQQAEANTHHVEQVEQTIGKDMKVVKCLLRAKNTKAKSNCGLED